MFQKQEKTLGGDEIARNLTQQNFNNDCYLCGKLNKIIIKAVQENRFVMEIV